MGTLGKYASTILWSLTSLLIALIALFALLHFASKYTPSPLSGVFEKLSDLASAEAYAA